MFKSLMIHPDNTQLMDKAVKLVQTGQWTNFGNRATKVGSIPGSFLTAITGLPMKIYFSPYSAMFIIFLFHLISYFLLRQMGFLIQQNFSILWLSVFFWLNPWRVEQSELYNPAYLFLFSTLHLWTALKMKHKNFWLSFFHIVILGFCFQTHFSFLILVFVSVGLFLTNQIKISWRGFIAGLGFVVLTLTPYLIDFFSNSTIEKNLDITQSDAFLGRNFVLVYPVIKSLIYFFRMGSLYLGRHIFSEIEFSWITSENLREGVSNIFHFIKWIFAVSSLVFSFYVIGAFLKKYPWQKKMNIKSIPTENTADRFSDYFMMLFVAVAITAGLSPVEFNHWHFILCFPAISLFMVFAVSKYKIHNKWMYSLAAIFIVWNIFAALGSRSHSLKNDYERDFFKHYQMN